MMAHNHPGPPSTSSFLAGCRDSRCIRSHDNYQRLRQVAKTTAHRPVAVQITWPELPRPVLAASVPEQLVTTEVPVVEDTDPGHSIFDAIRVLRHTAGRPNRDPPGHAVGLGLVGRGLAIPLM